MTGFASLVRFVSLRHVVSSPVRSLLTLFGVALGVAMLVGMTAANESVLASFRELADRASGKADLEVSGDEAGIDEAIVDDIVKRTDLVAHVAGRIEQTTFLEGHAGLPGQRVLVMGVDFLGDKAFMPFEKDSGADVLKDPLAYLNDPNAILIGDSLAAANGLKQGSTLRMRTTEGMTDFHVEAILKETGNSRAFGGQLVVLFLDAAQLAFGRTNKVDRIDVQLAPGVGVDAARPALQAIVGARGTVDRPSRRATQVAKMTQSFQIGLETQGAIAVFVGMFLIYNAVSVSVAQRRREIGILRSIGVTRGRVVGVFLAEAFVLGALGGAAGVAIGGGIARWVVGKFGPTVSSLYENIATPQPHLTPRLAGLGIVVGLVTTLLAAWAPARRASRTSPVETLRRDLHAGARNGLPVRGLAITGLVLGAVAFAVARTGVPYIGFLALACLLAASACVTPAAVAVLARPAAKIAERTLGIPARLGVDNVSRELGRSAITACALVLATAMSVTVACYTASYEQSCIGWLEQAVPADVVITAGSPLVDRNAVPFAPGVRDRIASVPGLKSIDMVRTLSVPMGGWRIEVMSLDTRHYLERVIGAHQLAVVDGPHDIPFDALANEPAVFVSENYARRTGVRAGASVELPSPSGPHAFKVVAVIVDYSTDQGYMLLDRRYMTEYWSDALVDSFDVYVVPGADPLRVAADLRARLATSGPEASGLFVTTNAALKDEVRRVVHQTFEVSKSSEIVALAIAILGVIGTMLAAVLDRVREIGVLRAIGATRRHIVLAVAAEAGFLGACAAAVGVAVSIPNAIIFVQTIGFEATGWSVPFRFPALAVLRVALSVVTFAIAGGLFPGWKAARLVIPQALAYE